MVTRSVIALSWTSLPSVIHQIAYGQDSAEEASFFCRGMMVASRECQTSTLEGVVRVCRRVFAGASGLGFLIAEPSLLSLACGVFSWTGFSAGFFLSLPFFFLSLRSFSSFPGGVGGEGKSLGLFSHFLSAMAPAHPGPRRDWK